jgi:hypothetical protein
MHMLLQYNFTQIIGKMHVIFVEICIKVVPFPALEKQMTPIKTCKNV